MKTVLRLITLFAVVAMLIPPTMSMAAGPTDLVKETIDGVIKILRDPSLKGPAKTEARRLKLRERIQERFSFEEMAMRSLGKHWKGRSEGEKKEFVEVFGTLIENSYVSKIEGYTDEEVIYDGEIVKDDASEVKTKIVTKSGTEIPINYRLKNNNGDWQVYDVIIEGVSLIRNYRSQFNEALNTSSFTELVKQLKEKTRPQG